MFNSFKKIFTRIFYTKYNSDPNLVLLFEYNGHKFYGWKKFDQMPLFREMQVRLKYASMGLGVHISDSHKFCEMTLETLKKDDIHDAMALVTFYQAMLKDYANEKLIIELGGLAVLIDDEPVNDMSEKHYELKRKLIAESQTLQFFFLTQAMMLLQNLSKDLDILNLKAYIQNPMRQKREKTFLKLIRSNLSQDLWTGLIQR